MPPDGASGVCGACPVLRTTAKFETEPNSTSPPVLSQLRRPMSPREDQSQFFCSSSAWQSFRWRPFEISSLRRAFDKQGSAKKQTRAKLLRVQVSELRDKSSQGVVAVT